MTVTYHNKDEILSAVKRMYSHTTLGYERAKDYASYLQLMAASFFEGAQTIIDPVARQRDLNVASDNYVRARELLFWLIENGE